MTESKVKKRKLKVLKLILKWVGLGLLVLLLITAIIFQAPWKVTTLFIIILLACTILPKPYRKWFWLSVGAVVLALIIWVFLPDETEGWRPYTFDKELATLEAKYAIPDEENAAIVYNQLLADYNESTFEPNFLDPNLEYLTRSEPWSSKDHPEIAQWLQQHESTIAKLLKASKIEKCRFPIVADMMAFGKHMKILAPMRRWAFLLRCAANNDLGEGRIDQAIEKQIAVLQIGKHQCQQPTMIDILVGIAIEALATSQFKTFFVTGDATEKRLSVIENALAEIKHDWSSDLPRILECEKLTMKNLFSMFYEINPEGKTRLSRNPYAKMRSWIKEQLDANQIDDQEAMELLKSHMYPTYWKKKLIKAATILGWFFVPTTPQKTAKIIDASYEKIYSMAEPDFDWDKEPEKPEQFSLTSVELNFRFMTELLAGMSEKSYYSIHDIYIRTIAQQIGSQIIITLRRFKNKTGQWPENLDEIKSLAPAEIFIDPINESSFVYKLTEENFILYSKGKNNIDEDGQYNATWDPNTFKSMVEEDDRLIWPTKLRKEREEKTDDEQQ